MPAIAGFTGHWSRGRKLGCERLRGYCRLTRRQIFLGDAIANRLLYGCCCRDTLDWLIHEGVHRVMLDRCLALHQLLGAQALASGLGPRLSFSCSGKLLLPIIIVVVLLKLLLLLPRLLVGEALVIAARSLLLHPGGVRRLRSMRVLISDLETTATLLNIFVGGSLIIDKSPVFVNRFYRILLTKG